MTISSIRVLPSGDPKSKLWIIGEAPGEFEEQDLIPFVGPSGQLLTDTLYRAGMKRENCYITNLSQYRPRDNDFKLLESTPQLASGIAEIIETASKYKPNAIILCGGQPLKYLAGKIGINKFRGSILSSQSLPGIKCIASLHPANILYVKTKYPIFDFDIRKAVAESYFPEFNYPVLELHVNDLTKLDECLSASMLTVDIETVKQTAIIRCIGFGYDRFKAVSLTYAPENQLFISQVLSSNVPKIFHNGIFDVLCLKINGVEVNNYVEDTLLQAHCLDPESPRSLAHLATLFTRIPYYKSGGDSDESDEKGWSHKKTIQELCEYNGKDCIVTFESYLEQDKDLKKDCLEDLYKYEMELQQAAIDISMKGMLVDQERVELFKKATESRINQLQEILNGIASKAINVRSNPTVHDFLYKELALPVRKKDKRVTADEDALVSLITFCLGRIDDFKTTEKKTEWNIKLNTVKILLELRQKLKLKSSYLDITLSEGRAKSMFKVAGTESGRWSADKFVDDSGLNLQTSPRGHVEVTTT